MTAPRTQKKAKRFAGILSMSVLIKFWGICFHSSWNKFIKRYSRTKPASHYRYSLSQRCPVQLQSEKLADHIIISIFLASSSSLTIDNLKFCENNLKNTLMSGSFYIHGLISSNYNVGAAIPYYATPAP